MNAKNIKNKLIAVLAALLCILLTLTAVIFALPDKKASGAARSGNSFYSVGNAKNDLYIGEGKINSVLLNELCTALTGTANYTKLAAKFTKTSTVFTSADFRAQQLSLGNKVSSTEGKNVSVWFGGIKWDAVYLSKNTNGNIILTLWQNAEGVNTINPSETNCPNQRSFLMTSKWANMSVSGASAVSPFPSNMYSTSYIRVETLNARGYAAYIPEGQSSTAANITIPETVHEPSEDHFYARFTMAGVENSVVDYLVRPADVPYQETENTPDYAFFSNTIYTMSNDAYGNPKNPSWYSNQRYNYGDASSGVDASNHKGHKGVGEGIPKECAYEYWKNDYLWLPSLSETGNMVLDSANGIWKTNTNLRVCNTSNANAWLRTASGRSDTQLCSIDVGAGVSESSSTHSTHEVRPAIHLNLTKVAGEAIQPEVTKPTETEKTIVYNGTQELDLGFGKEIGWVSFAAVDEEGVLKPEISKEDGTAKATKVGTYKVVAKLLDGYKWKTTATDSDTTGDVTFTIIVKPRKVNIKVKNVSFAYGETVSLSDVSEYWEYANSENRTDSEYVEDATYEFVTGDEEKLSISTPVSGTPDMGTHPLVLQFTDETAISNYDITFEGDFDASSSADPTGYADYDGKAGILTIEKNNMDMDGVQFEELYHTFDGTSKNIKVVESTLPTGVSVSSYTYYLGDSQTADERHAACGVYRVVVSFALDEETAKRYKVPDDIEVEMTIAIGKADKPVHRAGAKYIYNGGEQEILLDGFDEIKLIKAYFTAQDENKPFDGIPVNAGTYWVKIEPNDNCEWTEGGRDPIWISYVIEKADIDTDRIEFDGLTHTYDGTSKFVKVVETTLLRGVTVASYTYYLGDSQDEDTEHIVKGTYRVIVILQLEGDAAINYNQPDEIQLTMVIEVSNVGKPFLADGKHYTYNGLAQEIELEDYDETKLSRGYYSKQGDSDSISAPKNAGTYFIKVELTDSNYEWEGGGTEALWLSYTIERAEISVSKASPETGDYTGTEHTVDIIFTGLKNSESLEKDTDYGLTISGKGTTLLEIGSYTITVTLKDSEAAKNYKLSADGNTCTYVISAGTLNKPTANNLKETYKADYYEITVEGYDPETMEYQVTAGASFEDGVFKAKNAGEYTLTISIKEPSKYSWDDGGEDLVVTLEIDPYAITITADNKEVIYGGNAPEYTATYTTLGSDSLTITFRCNYVKGDGVGEYAIEIDEVTGEAAGNYTITLKSGKLTVTPKPIEIQISNAEHKYGENTAAIGIGDPEGGWVNEGDKQTLLGQLSFVLKEQSAPFSEVTLSSTLKVGKYDITSTDGTYGNYDVTFVNGEYEVKKGTYNLSGVEYDGSAVYTYDGTAKAHELLLLPEGVSVSYTYIGTDGTSYASSNAAPVNAGTYIVTATFTGDYENYEEIEEKTDTFTINRAKLKITGVRPASGLYTGNEHEGIDVVLSAVDALNINVDYKILFSCETQDAFGENGLPQGIGTYTVTIELISTDKTSNYELEEGTHGIYRITAGALSKPQAEDRRETYKADYYEITVEGFDPETMEYEVTDGASFEDGVFKAKNAGTYTLTISIKEQEKYSWEDGGEDFEVTLIIDAKEIELVINDTGHVYGEEPVTEYTVKNPDGVLEGDDTLEDIIGVVFVIRDNGAAVTLSSTTTAGIYQITAEEKVYGNYKVKFVAGTYTVEKADMSVDGVRFDGTSQSFDGTSKSISVVEGSLPEGVSVESYTYYYEGSDTADDTHSARGEYRVVVKFALSEETAKNYNAPSDIEVTMTINAGGINKPEGEDREETYAASEYFITVTDFDPETMEYRVTDGASFDGEVFLAKNAGEYKLTISLKDKSGNAWEDESTEDIVITLKINRAKLSIKAEDKEVTYGEAAPEYTAVITGLQGKDTIVVTYSCSYTVGSPVKDGGYEITVNPVTDANYDIECKSAKLTVKKATYDMSGVTLSNAAYLYDGDPHPAQISGRLPEGVAVTYEYYLNGEKIDGQPTEIGLYTVFVRFTHTNPNYNDIAAKCAYLRIAATQAGVDKEFPDTTPDPDGNNGASEELLQIAGKWVEKDGYAEFVPDDKTLSDKFNIVYYDKDENEVAVKDFKDGEKYTAKITIKDDYLDIYKFADGVENKKEFTYSDPAVREAELEQKKNEAKDELLKTAQAKHEEIDASELSDEEKAESKRKVDEELEKGNTAIESATDADGVDRACRDAKSGIAGINLGGQPDDDAFPWEIIAVAAGVLLLFAVAIIVIVKKRRLADGDEDYDDYDDEDYDDDYDGYDDGDEEDEYYGDGEDYEE